MSNVEEWKKQAEKKQQEAQQNYVNNNQHIIDAVNQQKQAALEQLKNENASAINQLEESKRDINAEALNNAKQANINRLLALRDNKNALNRAGLGTQGIVGSQVNSINSSYGNNLNDILNQKADSIQGVNSQIADTNLQYNTNLGNLDAEYAATIANTRASIEEAARQAGLQAYENEYNAQLQAWENMMAQKQYEESIRQYNESLALQKLQQQQDNALAWAQLNNSNYNFPNTPSVQQIYTDHWSGNIHEDAKYGVFANTKDKNGIAYQPDNVGGSKLQASGMQVKNVFNDAYGSKGAPLSNQKIWKTSDGRYYVWDGSINDYINVTSQVNSSMKTKTTQKWGW